MKGKTTMMKLLKNVLKFIFPEYQIIKAIKEEGLIVKNPVKYEEQIDGFNGCFIGNTKKILHIISQVMSYIWIATYFWLLLLVLTASPIALLESIFKNYTSGFVKESMGLMIIMMFLLIFGISMIIPPFRVWYKRLPWLFPYVVIFIIDIGILGIAEEIINYGLQLYDVNRHKIFLVIAIIQIDVCRIIMCTCFHKKPMKVVSNDFKFNHTENNYIQTIYVDAESEINGEKVNTIQNGNCIKNQNVSNEVIDINQYLYKNKQEHNRKIKKKKKSKSDKMLIGTGVIFVVIGIATIFDLSQLNPYTAVNESNEAYEAIVQQRSDKLEIGTRLFEDDKDIVDDKEKEYVIAHSYDDETAKIIVWDYAEQDGDYLQILIDGVAIEKPFLIKYKPVEIEVPVTGEVQVVGVYEGGGDGITYAIHFEHNGTTYFNGMNCNEGNYYTLIRE